MAWCLIKYKGNLTFILAFAPDQRKFKYHDLDYIIFYDVTVQSQPYATHQGLQQPGNISIDAAITTQ
jgi:hypothetical protein